ncbi:MAG: hypothetical protein RLZZ436_1929, partial [Planctomycetota bacterium]
RSERKPPVTHPSPAASAARCRAHYPQAAARRLMCAEAPGDASHHGAHPCPHLSGRAEAPGYASAPWCLSRHQHPLPAGCRQAAQRLLPSHFSLLTSPFSLPSPLHSPLYSLAQRAEAPGYTPLARGVSSALQGSLPAGCRQAAQRVFSLLTSHFSLLTSHCLAPL